ncbi:hypothetical protein M2337_001628 [Sphingobium sp. B2D3A]|uniref:hypothetical protein n=1 Tax=unclassified Sphingobium TaxID=2611147 RepID=UPI0022250908|nr:MULTISPECIES: hypothetical protein [unclassified Sphingobium]MCW2337395.1 hypothetical protein [Sphingobium sp. B2D3A]MCW2383853.1 hypothetical protein [Sphingobium sp. B2D3D]
MATHIDEAVLRTPQIASYLSTADRRIVSGFRMALELLGVPVPEAALRKPNGRPSIAAVMAVYDRDNRSTNTYRDERRKVGIFAPKPSA